jgi:hypothetical protein
MSDDPPKRRGRPALTPGEGSVNLHLRLATIDYDKACAIARKNGVSVPQVLRAAFRMATRQQRTIDEP